MSMLIREFRVSLSSVSKNKVTNPKFSKYEDQWYTTAIWLLKLNSHQKLKQFWKIFFMVKLRLTKTHKVWPIQSLFNFKIHEIERCFKSSSILIGKCIKCRCLRLIRITIAKTANSSNIRKVRFKSLYKTFILPR